MPRWPYMSDADYIAKYKAKCAITESGCWQWREMPMGLKGWQYPEGMYRHQRWRLNRLMVTLTQRPMIKGEMACHKCDNHRCINPDHLFIATNRENLLDASRKGRMPGQSKTHCKHNHEFTSDNTYWSVRGLTAVRNCRTCQRIRQRVKNFGWTLEEARSTPVIPPHAATARRRGLSQSESEGQ